MKNIGAAMSFAPTLMQLTSAQYMTLVLLSKSCLMSLIEMRIDFFLILP